MKTYEFSIIASGLDPNAEDFEARFYDNGCDDSLVAFQKGHIILDFARDAECIEDAIASAIEDVRKVGATVDRIEPDPLVNLTEIAARSGMTKAAISHYAKGNRQKGFPAPRFRVTTDSPLWEWASVARWLFGLHKLTVEDLAAAEAVSRANEVVQIEAAVAANELAKPKRAAC